MEDDLVESVTTICNADVDDAGFVATVKDLVVPKRAFGMFSCHLIDKKKRENREREKCKIVCRTQRKAKEDAPLYRERTRMTQRRTLRPQQRRTTLL